MSNLFSGLEELGLNKAKDIKLYKDEEEKETKKKEKKEIKMSDFLFLKSSKCPVCGNEFKTHRVKTGSVRLSSVDTDLRPKYEHIDTLKYGVTLCNKCGYATLNQDFNTITLSKKKLVLEKVSSNYKSVDGNESDELSYDESILRHKLALLNTVVTKGGFSEKAYTCLRIAWLIRGKREDLEKSPEQEKEEIAKLKQEEMQFIENAYEGFEKAYSSEDFPISGMDINTLSYLLGELARRLGKYDEAGKWASQVIISKNASRQIKDRARQLRDRLREDKKREKE